MFSRSKKAERDALEARLRAQRELRIFGEVQTPTRGQLSEPEQWWHQHYEWLKNCGYLLRSRYQPNWTPSWLGTEKDFYDCEDGRVAKFASRLLDATRLSDGSRVVLKLVNKHHQSHEVEIGQFFSSEPLAGERDNYCIPIYDVLRVPEDEEITVIVMPLLSSYNNPSFDTFGEAMECFRQLFEGLLFMHKHRVAHRDCTSRNIMMDPTSIYLDEFHPVHPKMKRDFSGIARFRTRTEGRPRYFLIDFGLSRRYDPSVVEPKEDPILGADKTVPEFQNSNEPRDPFPTDVYYIGNMIKIDFVERMHGFDFLRPLIANMVHEDPSKRPTMQDVVDRFHVIQAGLSTWKLRSRIVDKDERTLNGVFCGVSHWVRRVKFMRQRVPALPTPPSES